MRAAARGADAGVNGKPVTERKPRAPILRPGGADRLFPQKVGTHPASLYMHPTGQALHALAGIGTGAGQVPAGEAEGRMSGDVRPFFYLSSRFSSRARSLLPGPLLPAYPSAGFPGECPKRKWPHFAAKSVWCAARRRRSTGTEQGGSVIPRRTPTSTLAVSSFPDPFNVAMRRFRSGGPTLRLRAAGRQATAVTSPTCGAAGWVSVPAPAHPRGCAPDSRRCAGPRDAGPASGVLSGPRGRSGPAPSWAGAARDG